MEGAAFTKKKKRKKKSLHLQTFLFSCWQENPKGMHRSVLNEKWSQVGIYYYNHCFYEPFHNCMVLVNFLAMLCKYSSKEGKEVLSCTWVSFNFIHQNGIYFVRTVEISTEPGVVIEYFSA